MTKFLLHIPLLVGLLLVPALGRADFQAGADAYLNMDYDTALAQLRPLAEQGNAKAQHILGEMYLYGYGVPEDKSEGIRWYQLSATQGNVEAQQALGDIYVMGYGPDIPEDWVEARKWYKLAAEQGDDWSQVELGRLYWDGKGVKKNIQEATKWFQLAAKQGNNRAKRNLETIQYLGSEKYKTDKAKHDADIARGKPILPEEYTILCAAEKNLGFRWKNGDWVPTQFTPTSKRLVVKSKKHDCTIYEGEIPEDHYWKGSITKHVCLDVKEIGEQFSLGPSRCEEWYHPVNGTWHVRISCGSLILRPNGWYHYSMIHSQLEDQPEDDYKDSLHVEVGKCSMIAP